MYSKIALIATLAVAAASKEVCTTTYKKTSGYDGHRGNDIKCGFKSHAAISAFCTANPKCQGFSWYSRKGWWCAKHKGGVGPKDSTHNWYQKERHCKEEEEETTGGHENFGDLSFLNSEEAYKRALAARAKFLKEHERLVAHRRHETLAYFKAHHHEGFMAKERARFAAILKAKVEAHERATKAHGAAVEAEGKASHHLNEARKNVVAKAHHLMMAKLHERHMKSAQERAEKHEEETHKKLEQYEGERDEADKHRKAALHETHVWKNRLAEAKKAHAAAVEAEEKAEAHHEATQKARAKAKAHREEAEHKLGVARAAHEIALRKFKASREAAIRANNAVKAHHAAGVAAGHI